MLTEEDLLIAANGMMEHLALMREKVVDSRSNREKAADILGTHISKAKSTEDINLFDFVNKD